MATPTATMGELAYLPQSFVLCPIPQRQPKDSSWSRLTPYLDLHIVSDPRYGVPYGEDRLIFMWLATQAILQDSPHVRLGSAHDLLRAFNMGPNGRNYQRLIQRIQRVFYSTYSFCAHRPDGSTEERKMVLCYAHRLWFDSPIHGKENSANLTPEFWNEIQRGVLPVPRNLALELLDSPGNFDFAVWVMLQANKLPLGKYLRIPLCGESGLPVRMGLTPYRQDRDYRSKIRFWLANLQTLWKDCSACLVQDSKLLVIWRSPAPQKRSPNHINRLQIRAFRITAND